MTAGLYIIPLITRLLANTEKKLHSMSLYDLFVTVNVKLIHTSGLGVVCSDMK